MSNVVLLKYPTASEITATARSARLRLALDGSRPQVGLMGGVAQPELFRDALLTAVDVRNSDLRYKGRDRTAYLAFLMKKGKKATAAIWEAQKAFLEATYGDERSLQRGLDPMLTVDADEVSLEVFSRDESAWSRLCFDTSMFDNPSLWPGTAACDLSDGLVDRIQRLRTYQPLDVEVGTGLVGNGGASADREVEVPDEWLRGFLQVQSAATLPSTSVTLAPIDLYDILYALRVRKAKKAPRALRFELVPGMRPRVVLEPWETAIECHSEVYRGSTPRVVRTYGRRRLLTLARALPHLTGARVHLLGPGLPSFWVLDMGKARLTMALTSWTDSKWAGAASFDALMPGTSSDDQLNKAVGLLQQRGPLPLDGIAQALGVPGPDARKLLQRACLRGQVLFDMDRAKYRYRPLLAEAVDDGRIRYGSPREAQAHRLLGDPGAEAEATGVVSVTKVHVLVGEGTEVAGEVMDKPLARTFTPRFTLDLEGQVVEAWCNCATYLRSGLREGPCEHMIALYVQQRREAEEIEQMRKTPEGRKRIRAETRTLHRRDVEGNTATWRISLDDTVVRIARQQGVSGRPLGDPRHQRIQFDTDNDARENYFSRLDQLAASGFIDTDAVGI